MLVKNNKQRRAELMLRLRASFFLFLRGDFTHSLLTVRGQTVLVDNTKLAPDGSYSEPEFQREGFYRDFPFTCQHCGKKELWTAAQQKWWYEVAQGNRWTTARLCRPCRQRERKRREEARKASMDSAARKTNWTTR